MNLPNKTRLCIVDDHNLILDTLKTVLDKAMENTNISTYNNPLDLLNNYTKKKYQIALLDISMKEMSGIDLAEKLLKIDENLKIIFLTMHNDIEHIEKCFDLKILGYLNKNSGIKEIVKAIESAKKNKVYCSPDISTKLYESIKKNKSKKEVKNQKKEVFNLLTQREKELLGFIINSKTTREIALMLNLSIHTVSTHRKNINKKLGTSNIIELVNNYKELY